jgi:hypothetical protein
MAQETRRRFHTLDALGLKRCPFAVWRVAAIVPLTILLSALYRASRAPS